MGQSSSTARRRRRYTTEISSSTTTNNYSSSSFSHQPPPPPPPSTSSNYPYYSPNPYNHPPPNPNYYYSSSNSYQPPSYQHQLTHAVNSVVTFVESLIKPTTSSGTSSRPNTNFYYANYGPPPNRFSGPSVPTQLLPGHHPPPPPPPPPSSLQQQEQPPPQFVESQNAKTVKNEVNIHKDTIRFIFDEKNDHHLLSFTFDASADGSISIYYFAKEEEETCIFSPAYPDIYRPTKFSFQEGPGQIFCQPSGSGINLVFFAQEDLSKPLEGNIFPLVICINNKEATCAQITEAVIEKMNNGSFEAKVIKQILLVNGERYELQEIYGLVNSSERQAESNDDSDSDERGKECVICLSEPRNTAVFPCRHMCLCSDCAKALRTQSNKCPICRQPVEKLMEINVNKGN